MTEAILYVMLLQLSSGNQYQDGHPRFETRNWEDDKRDEHSHLSSEMRGMCLRQIDILDLI